MIIFRCCDGRWKLNIREKVFLREWMSVCLAVDLVEQKWKAATNGKVRYGGYANRPLSPIRIREGGNLIIGQDQDSFDKDFNAYESLCGSLTNLRIYDTLLTTKEMISFTTCRSFTPENLPILDLSNVEAEFALRSVDIEIRKNEEYCDTQREFDAIFPELREFQDGARLCHVVGGEVKVPQNEYENEQLFQNALEYVNVCGEGYAETFWLGVAGDVDTQNWTHYRDNSPINYKKINRDYGTVIEHPEICMAFTGSKETSPSNYGVWTPRACHLELCSVCSLDRIKLIRMRGLCRQSHFDRDYFLTYERESPAFAGVKYSQITKKPPNSAISDSEYGFWLLNRADKPQALAILDMKYPSHYPIGRNTWRVDNDVCGKEEVSLFMTSCLDRQFSCADGTCIDIQHRCDLEANCPDESDEVNCKYIRLPKGYDNANAPSRTDQSGAIKIYLQIDLLSLRHIDLSNFKFTCELNMHLRWTDNRLEYLHLNHDETLNVVDEDSELPWIPKLNFQGDGNTTSTVHQRQRFIKVRRLSDPLPDNDENESEDEIFSGKYNSLVESKKLTVISSCDFNLGNFPFDRQTCSMVSAATQPPGAGRTVALTRCHIPPGAGRPVTLTRCHIPPGAGRPVALTWCYTQTLFITTQLSLALLFLTQSNHLTPHIVL
ncbi:uncharacterized protein [Panulirus ornatus]|uniref:uncharacterized protein n=1 Tax=Panulirus ornatus TaxID=150431 RepID=UPI003A840886